MFECILLMFNVSDRRKRWGILLGRILIGEEEFCLAEFIVEEFDMGKQFCGGILWTLYDVDENECFVCLMKIWTKKPYKKVNIIYWASAAYKSLQAPSFLILIISLVAYSRAKHFWKKCCTLKESIIARVYFHR